MVTSDMTQYRTLLDVSELIDNQINRLIIALLTNYM